MKNHFKKITLMVFMATIFASILAHAQFALTADTSEKQNFLTTQNMPQFLSEISPCSTDGNYKYSTTIALSGLADGSICRFQEKFSFALLFAPEISSRPRLYFNFQMAIGPEAVAKYFNQTLPIDFDMTSNDRIKGYVLTGNTPVNALGHSGELKIFLYNQKLKGVQKRFVMMYDDKEIASGVLRECADKLCGF